MPKKRMTHYWLGTLIAAVLFTVLMLVKTGVLTTGILATTPSTVALSGQGLSEQDTWMTIFQNDEKIGYSHTVFKKVGDTYESHETLYMQLVVMGMARQVKLATTGILNNDLTVRSFSVSISSGRFDFSANGRVEGQALVIETETGGKTETITLPVAEPPYLSAGLLPAVLEAGPAPGDTLTFPVFDPSVMASMPVKVTVEEKGEVRNMGRMVAATRMTLSFKGSEQSVWVSEDGEILEESGLMGLKLVKTGKAEAMAPITGTAGDFTELAAIPVDVSFDNPEALKMLQVKISGAELPVEDMSEGRQQLAGQILTIEKETLAALDQTKVFGRRHWRYLKATPFIQSNDPEIVLLANDIVKGHTTVLEKGRALVNWVYEEIDKRPVVSLPDARSTLKNREGDCNEHAVLLAALARAVGFPARVETGLVYMNGRFFYHAWNRLFLGRWITADAALGQLPADVTHIRLALGAEQQQLDLIPLIGRLELEIISFE